MSDEKREREAPRATARAKVCKPAVQEQAADSVSQKEVEAAPAAVPSRADQPLNDESRGDGLPSYDAGARFTLRSFRRPATRARRLPRLRAVVSSASTGCREPSVPASVLGP